MAFRAKAWLLDIVYEGIAGSLDKPSRLPPPGAGASQFEVTLSIA